MKVLITGASGYIGHKIAHVLADKGLFVHALVRSDVHVKWLQHPNIKVFKGDILTVDSLRSAMKNCSQVYHAAAKVGAWAAVPGQFYNVNVEGTRNVLDISLESGVEKLVFTSTGSLFGPSDSGPLNEGAVRHLDFKIDYDHSKKLAEELVLNYAANGFEAIIVNPSKVYGPGHTSHSLTTNAMIKTFIQKKYTVIPSPGTFQLCFAYIDDVVEGHVLAMEHGKKGEKYILGGHNLSYFDFFNSLRILGNFKASIIPLPKWMVKFWAYGQQLNHQVIGTDIRFPVEAVDHVFSHYIFSSEKAIQQLGYRITDLDKALLNTINFLKR